MRFWPTLLLFAAASLVAARAQTNVIIPTRSVWRYSDLNAKPGDQWMGPEFDDRLWTIGVSPLGYGEPNVSLLRETMTAYFRRAFTLTNAPDSWLTLRLRRDDGVIVYLNGLEVFRNNMPTGSVQHFTQALTAVEPTNYIYSLAGASYFVLGANVVAAEVHQNRIDSPDFFFDLELFATNGGPRLAITIPVDNSAVRTGSDLPIEALAEPVESLAYVEFFIGEELLGRDTDAPFQIIWTNVTTGNHLLRALAATAEGFSFGSLPVRVRVAETFVPVGSITSPADNATLGSGDISLEATASDPDGTVMLVEFFVNGVKVGEDTSAPYSIVWADASVGDYSILARMTDDSGLIVNTAPVNVRVRFAGAVSRGPYLQIGTSISIVVKWRTAVQSDSVVRFGSSSGNLLQSALVATLTTEHEVKLTGLLPDSRYYYSIGSSSATSVIGPDLSFVTSPAVPKPTRIWAIGDSGTGTPEARAVYNEYLKYAGSRYTDIWLMLGDNAYDSGTDAEYQRGVFEMYPKLLAQSVVWPTIGNHDATPAYFDIFSLPRNAEAGGIASGVENYYSFDYSDIHFVCLGGYYSGTLSSNGPMCGWLKADLEANTKKWLIAFWHQPPYTKGSHDSDQEQDLIAMRENAVPILESYGVDLVLGGHSHSYERSYLMHGHYGHSSTLDRSTMLLNSGSGRVDETGPYVKRTSGSKAHHGTVYVVNGTSGHATFGSVSHPAMFVGYLRMGSLVLDVDGDTLHGTFLRETGAIDDYFTITKAAPELRIISFEHEAATCTISWASVAGAEYEIEHTTKPGSLWSKLQGPITATGAVTSVTYSLPSTSASFYRVRELD